jgi:hypothetical protein
MRRFGSSWDANVLGAMGVGLVLFVGLAFASVARPPVADGEGGTPSIATATVQGAPDKSTEKPAPNAAQCREGQERERRPCA